MLNGTFNRRRRLILVSEPVGISQNRTVPVSVRQVNRQGLLAVFVKKEIGTLYLELRTGCEMVGFAFGCIGNFHNQVISG